MSKRVQPQALNIESDSKCNTYTAPKLYKLEKSTKLQELSQILRRDPAMEALSAYKPHVGKTPSTLCTHCQNINIDHSYDFADGELYADYNRDDLYPELPALTESAAAGCGMCDVWRTTILEAFYPESQSPKLGPKLREQGSLVLIQTLHFSLKGRGRNKCQLGGFFNLYPEAQDRSQFSPSGPGPIVKQFKFSVYADNGKFTTYFFWLVWVAKEVPGSPAATRGKSRIERRLPNFVTLSSTNVGLIKKWIGDCLIDHEVCRSPASSFVPTRLLHIKGDGENISLVLTDKCDNIKYLALSHCWGLSTKDHPHFKTERANMADRIARIPSKEMPQNFQDAAIVARTFGVEYMWIDSLCIIQDDQQDWETEAASMCAIYEHAYLTIVATSAAESHEGFLKRTSSRIIVMPYPSSTAPEGVFYIDPDPRDGIYDLVESSKWNRRGWTFQERILSLRLLHFTKKAVYFECKVCKQSEYQDEEVSEIVGKDPFSGFIVGRNSSIVQPSKYPGGVRDEHRKWYDLVGDFSQRELTFQSDKLPALSGLAHQFAEKCGDKYLAGIWKDDVVRGIMWQRVSVDDETRRPLEYRAPTWTWASIDGAVAWRTEYDVFKGCVECVWAGVGAPGRDPMGRVVGGYLHLAGRVKSVTYITYNSTMILDGGAHAAVRFDVELHYGAPRNAMIALLVMMYEDTDGDDAAGLLLEAIPKMEHQDCLTREYRRVGMFRSCELEGIRAANIFDEDSETCVVCIV